MISNDFDTSPGCARWFRWLIGTGFALVAAGSSLVAILQYFDPPTQVPVPSDNPVNVVVITSQPVSDQAEISPEQWQAVESFLEAAVVAEITAYQYGDPSYATMFYGDALQRIQDQIADLNSKGILLSARFDFDNSYVHDIRVTQSNRIEVDSCEYWANDYYDRQTGMLLGSDSWTLVPQTIMIEYLNANFYITSVAFYNDQSFCY
jgi:hypothetical protein